MTILIGGLPKALSERLSEEYLEIKKKFALNDWGPSQLKGGRFAEVLIRIFQHLLGETITPFGSDVSAKEKTRILNTAQNHPTIDEHVRQKVVVLTRLLLDFRNNRDSAHLGGFNANSMDTAFVLTASTWALCELVRVYGKFSMTEAQEIVEGLTIKDYPVILERGGEIFITRHNLKAKQEVLVLLTRNDGLTFDVLFSKTKDSNKTRFETALKEMVAEKLIGKKGEEYFIMPRGQSQVQKESLLSYSPDS